MLRTPTRNSRLIRKWAHPKIYGKGAIAQSVKETCSFPKEVSKSPLLCLNPYFAFWFRTKYEKSPLLNHERKLVQYPDGGVASIDKIIIPGPHQNIKAKTPEFKDPIILVFPGGNENTWATKVQTLCLSFISNGFRDVFLCNYRGKSMTPLKTPQFSLPFGRFNDIQHTVSYIEEYFPNRKIILVGNCFGGHFIIDYLTCKSHLVSSNVIGAVLHSVQWNCSESTRVLLKEPLFSLFMKPWANYTKDILIKNFSDEVAQKIGEENFKIFSALSFDKHDDIDKMYDAGLGYLVDGLVKDQFEYARLSSPHLKLREFPIAKPVIMINSEDDPTAPLSSAEIDEIVNDENMCLSLLSCGGHCAYVKSMIPTTNFIDEIMVESSNLIFKLNDQ